MIFIPCWDSRPHCPSQQVQSDPGGAHPQLRPRTQNVYVNGKALLKNFKPGTTGEASKGSVWQRELYFAADDERAGFWTICASRR
jgi:hypothetical protein